MRVLRRWLTRLLNCARTNRSDERLREEMAWHLASQAEDNIRSGMVPLDAHRSARLKFGPVEAVREQYHSETGLPFFENLLLDVRYSLRGLRKSPSFTLVALLTLMLGIGANLVVFGVLNAVILQPLAVSHPESLYQFRHQSWSPGKLLTTSYPAFEDFERRNTVFSGLTGIDAYSHAALTWKNATTSVSGAEVTGNYFDVLGVQAQTGRFFRSEDEHGPDSAPYVVLSDGLWHNLFQGDPHIVGTPVELNKHPFTVIGVAKPDFHGTERFSWPDYWIPMVNEEQVSGFDYLHIRTEITVTVIGRLKVGITSQQATDNLKAISSELNREYPETDDGQPLRLIHPGLMGDEGDAIRGFLWSITALALLVLAAACANLASLFAARTSDRSRELALRIALGSSRRRLIKQLLTEATLIALAGGAAGLAVADVLLRALDKWQSPYGHVAISVDWRVYFAGLLLALTSALVFGLIPAQQALQSAPRQMMSGATTSTRLRKFALRDLLLGVQIAICTLLVVASLVAVRGMVHELQAPLGFKPQGAMLASIDLGHEGQSDDVILQDQKAIIDASLTIPGVTAAGAVTITPMTGGLHGIPIFHPETTDFRLSHSALSSYVFSMSPGYLQAAGTRLLSGRDFSWHDTAATPSVAIVNMTFANRMWGEAPVIGQRFIVSGKLTEIVGIAEDGKYHDFAESPQPVVYLPLSQTHESDAVFVVRSHRTPSEMTAALQHTLSAIAPDVSLTVQSWTDSLSGEIFPAQAATVALGIMGSLAAMLAVTGVFGMAAYNVSRRMKELGIRAALGACRMQIVGAAIGRPIVLLSAGSASGLVAGVFASGFLGHIVYQANPRDPVVFCGAVLTMTLLGILASAIPARRALSIDPSRLMREE